MVLWAPEQASLITDQVLEACVYAYVLEHVFVYLSQLFGIVTGVITGPWQVDLYCKLHKVTNRLKSKGLQKRLTK